jgi:class 3 adenylate cyclase
MAAAAGGEVLLTTAAYEAVAGSGIRFSAAGQHSLKGLREPRLLYRVEHGPDSGVRDP